jgi:hypothetical protein
MRHMATTLPITMPAIAPPLSPPFEELCCGVGVGVADVEVEAGVVVVDEMVEEV